MGRETTWLGKLRHRFTNGVSKSAAKLRKSPAVGVLAFEVAGLFSKLLALRSSLSDESIARLRSEAVALDGVRKIVSNDDEFLLRLACAELLHSLHTVTMAVASNLAGKCEDPSLRCFLQVFDDFAERGRDPNNWLLSTKELDALTRKLDRQITATTVLYREMEELTSLENSLRKSQQSPNHKNTKSDAPIREQNVYEAQQKIVWQRHQVKSAKEKSLWSRNFDSVTLSLARMIFTILARIKLVFGIGHGYIATSLPRSLSANSATVFPSIDHHHQDPQFSGPLRMINKSKDQQEAIISSSEFFDSNTKILNPPPGTLGASALALHYSNLIIVLEKMVRSPHLVGFDARDDLYAMLPSSIRSSLRSRLRGVGFSPADPSLAGEWRDALGRILGWLSPLAHNMINWQRERSFEQQNQLEPKTNLLLLQTLTFANKAKTEAAITELLVGLNYIWRFEREMNARALFECSNFINGCPQMQSFR